MKFIAPNFLAVLCVGSQVLSAPILDAKAGLQALSAPILDTRAASTITSLQAEIYAVATAVNADLVALNTLVKNTATDANSQARLIVNARTILNDIVFQFNKGGSQITSTTTGAPTQLSAKDISSLASLLKVVNAYSTQTISILATLDNHLLPTAKTAVQPNYYAAVGSIQSFVNPLVLYSKSVTQVGGGTSATGLLGGVVSSLVTGLGKLLGGLGL